VNLLKKFLFKEDLIISFSKFKKILFKNKTFRSKIFEKLSTKAPLRIFNKALLSWATLNLGFTPVIKKIKYIKFKKFFL